MTELETQVVKIQLGDQRQATSFIYTLAEKMDASGSELYLICELPMFNPAAKDECERIATAVAASLKRSYRKTVSQQTFENSLTIVNEELGKLVTLGKTHWLGKLNAVIAVKHGTTLSVASAGKISALLYRDGNFAPITEAASPTHPLKTFENFSVGRLKLGDLLVLSTTQLFNHISVDRIKNIFKRNELPEAAQEIISTLQELTGPEIACGTILALQVEPGITTDEEVDLQEYMTGPQVNSTVQDENWIDKLKSVTTTATTISKNVGGDLKTRFKNQKLPDFVKGKAGISMVQNQFKRVTNHFQPEKIKGYSRQKKFFLISAAILLLALVANITIAKYFRGSEQVASITPAAIEQLEKLANDANAAMLYGDEEKAVSLLSDLKTQLQSLTNVPEDQKIAVDKVRAQAQELQNKIDKVTPAQVTTLGALSNSDHLIVLPDYFATESNRNIVAYNRKSGTIQDNILKSSEPITRSAYFKGNQAIIHNGTELLLWNFVTDVLGGAFTDSVPNQNNSAGLRVYPTNSRVYLIDKSRKEVISFAATDKAFSKPTVSFTAPELSNASDLAIDGSIYFVADGTIYKYNSGKKQDFVPQVSSLAANAKIYTEINFANLYILDGSNKRIVILDKSGNLITSLTSDQFNDLKDFYVDEKAKTVYVLNNNSLLSVKF